MGIKLVEGDCLEQLRKLDDNSIESLVTDPPAGIAFMGKDWDKDKGGRDGWINWMTEIMQECHRVLKPGAHGFVWAIPRTSHWTATALENAGFEIRDIVTHVFGSGFPKSHNISKAIDKKFGGKRKVIATKTEHNIKSGKGNFSRLHNSSGNRETIEIEITEPATAQAKQWDGFGTSLKPASEHWILVRKRFKGTVADNVLKYGTGGLNIDACRIGTEKRFNPPTTKNKTAALGSFAMCEGNGSNVEGRFPANFICSGEARELLDAQSGISKSTGGNSKNISNKIYGKYNDALDSKPCGLGDIGGASRFFYCAKASKKERNAGLEHLEAKSAPLGDDRPSGQSMSRLDGRLPREMQNHHPTVKPQKLMRYLITMITPPNGTVLDPFMGSGSTGVACKDLGFGFTGIEKEKEYFKIASDRINNAHEIMDLMNVKKEEKAI